jgi:hypothetical protein
MRKRSIALAGGVVVLVAGLGAGAVVATHHHQAAAADQPTTTGAQKTAKVERRDLIQTTDVSGTIGYGAQTAVKASANGGTITGLAKVGSVVRRGQSLYEVNGLPEGVVMYGARPMWRTLQNGVSDGPDVHQLEQNLVAMGFADPSELTVDNHFNSATTTAVKKWQALLGRDDTAQVAVDDIWFTSGPVRVAAQSLSLGDAATGTILQTTKTGRQVHVDLDASQGLVVTPLEKVTVTLTDGSTVDGLVAVVGTTATTTTSGNTTTTTIPIDINLARDVNAPDESPVTVSLATSTAKGVLAVPVKALLALSEGGYAVQKVEAGGPTQLVGVQLGSFAGGYVEVRGNLQEGDTVVTA